jgi:RNA polymerase sigma-70 factor (ECF subfamily)
MGTRLVAEPELGPDILEGYRRGDPVAQRHVFERYRDRVFSIARHYLKGDDAAAKDVTQEVFVRVFRAAPSFRADARLSTWLYRIVANACIDELRRRRRVVLFGDMPPSIDRALAASDPAAPAAAAPSAAPAALESEVSAAVERLSPKLRMVVLLRYFDDLSYEEIARALGCSAGTVASRLNRAHRALARKLAHLAPGRPPAESTDVADA